MLREGFKSLEKLLRPAKVEAPQPKAKYIAFYDPDSLTPEQHLWLLAHAGEVVNLPITIHPDGRRTIQIPATTHRSRPIPV
jgi:hypothetical protein